MMRAGNLDVITPGLLQVWFSTFTLEAMREIIASLSPKRVACLSCPSVFYHLSEEMRNAHGVLNFEFDRRWADDDGFVFFDCYQPTQLPPSLHQTFDLLIADPPAINTKTLECYATSIRLLAGPGAKILFSTMENFDATMYDLLGLSPKPFKPDLPGFGLDGRWSFYANFGCDRLAERNPEAEGRRRGRRRRPRRRTQRPKTSVEGFISHSTRFESQGFSCEISVRNSSHAL